MKCKGSQSSPQFPPTESRLLYGDYYPIIHPQIRTAWQATWEGLDERNYFQELKESPQLVLFIPEEQAL